jgi:hypothetical protein
MRFFPHIVVEVEEDCCFFFLGTLLERYHEYTSKISLHLFHEDMHFNSANLTQMALNLAVRRKHSDRLFKEIYIDSEKLHDDYLGPSTSEQKHLVLLSCQLCEWLLLKD